MKKTMKRIVTLTLALMMVLSVAVVQSPIEANAASTKKVTATKSYKKSPALKVGNNKVTAKQFCYTKFTAPKAGTYLFTVSGVTSTGNTNTEIGYGCVYLEQPTKYGYMNYCKIKTNKAKAINKLGTKKVNASGLGICTKYCWDKFDKASWTKGKSKYVYTRYMQVSLKKGETVYMMSHFSGRKAKHTYNVKIKKK